MAESKGAGSGSESESDVDSPNRSASTSQDSGEVEEDISSDYTASIPSTPTSTSGEVEPQARSVTYESSKEVEEDDRSSETTDEASEAEAEVQGQASVLGDDHSVETVSPDSPEWDATEPSDISGSGDPDARRAVTATSSTDSSSEKSHSSELESAGPRIDEESKDKNDRKDSHPRAPISKDRRASNASRMRSVKKTRVSRKVYWTNVGWLYLATLLVAALVSLIRHLTNHLLHPLTITPAITRKYDPHLIASLTIIPGVSFWRLRMALDDERSEVGISARTSLGLIAMSADLIAVGGRRLGAKAMHTFGSEIGAAVARGILSMGVVCGGLAFASLSYDYMLAKVERREAMPIVMVMQSAVFMAHVYAAGIFWSATTERGTNILVKRPEQSILLTSLLITLVSLLFITDKPSSSSFSHKAHNYKRSLERHLRSRYSLSRSSISTLRKVLSYLPPTSFALLLLIRLPIIVFAVNQQAFLRPSAPYSVGHYRVLHSQRGNSGHYLVGEHQHLKMNGKRKTKRKGGNGGFRFLRKDGQVLSGRYVRGGIGNDTRSVLGDFLEISTTEMVQLAVRRDKTDTIARTLSLTTGLIYGGNEEEIVRPRALMIGSGASTTPTALTQHGFKVDLVHPDPLPLLLATRYLGAKKPDTITPLRGDKYLRVVADLIGSDDHWRQTLGWDFVRNVREVLEDNGILAVSLSGLPGANHFATALYASFPQCRAFGESMSFATIICSVNQTPILSFRRPTPHDVSRSPMRTHSYSRFMAMEIPFLDRLPDPIQVNETTVIADNATQVDTARVQIEVWPESRMTRGIREALSFEQWISF